MSSPSLTALVLLLLQDLAFTEYLLSTWLKGKTRPSKWQSSIIFLTLFNAGTCSSLPLNLTCVNVKVDRRILDAGCPQTISPSFNWKFGINLKPELQRRFFEDFMHFEIKGSETNLYTFSYWLFYESIQIRFASARFIALTLCNRFIN